MVFPVLGATDIMLSQTSKAASTSKFNWYGMGYEVGKFSLKLGSAIGGTLLAYKYLVESDLIERGAEQFGTGYGHSLPIAYYESQKETMPKLKQMEAELYQQYAPMYEEVEIRNIWREAEAKAMAYEYYSPYYTGSTSTEKANTKMPYTPKVL